MPNGGPNCTWCAYFKPDEFPGFNGDPESAKSGYCLVHKVAIVTPHWTHCANGTDAAEDPIPEPKGPLRSTSGIYESGYSQLPFYQGRAPEVVSFNGPTPYSCDECDRDIPVNKHEIDALVIDDDGVPRFFCCNLHYVEWWKKKNPGQHVRIDPDWRVPESDGSQGE